MTFSKDVAPILYAHCASCHRPGEAGGFSLLTFADARPRAAMIARVTRARTMPPWKPAAVDGAEFIGARRLEQADVDTLQQWAAAGAPEGNAFDRPAPPVFPDGWQLGTPDLVVTMREPIEVLPGDRDLLRNVVIPTALDSARYVRGLEFRPDNAQVVHHANIRVDRSRTARTFDGADGRAGFDGRLTGGAAFPEGQFLGWTPGQLPPLLEDGNAWRLDPGSDLVVQLHLRPTERAEHVRVRIGLYFAARAPSRTPVMLRLGRQDIDIAPGSDDYEIDDSYRLPVGVSVLAVQPHAHQRARSVTGSAVLPNGRERELLRIDDWDFDWQDQYRYSKPIELPAGTVLRMTYRFDNSAANRRNPDFPPRRVLWGQQTSDEMGDLWFQVVTATDRDRQTLAADVGRKVLIEDAVGYETMIRSDGRNARLHEAAAALQLSLGQVDRGIAHLNAALALNPRSAEAQYNLGTALLWQGRTAEAREHLLAAMSVAPDHVGAHVNLAAVLRREGDASGARAQLDRALTIDPQNAAAHTSLGGLLTDSGQIAAGTAEYRLALRTNPDLVEAATELSWTLAVSPDAGTRNPNDAVRLAEHARALTGDRDIRTSEALAAAYAAAGRFQDAVAAEEVALTLASAAGVDQEGMRLLRDRLALYRDGKPFRDQSRAERKR